MKKFLLSLSVAMLSFVGAWAQGFDVRTSDVEGAAVRRIEITLSGNWLDGDNVEEMTTGLIDLVMGYNNDEFVAAKAFTEVTIKSPEPAEGEEKTTVTVNQALVQQLVSGKKMDNGQYSLADNKIVRLDLRDVAVTEYVGHPNGVYNSNATLSAGGSSKIQYLGMPSFAEIPGQTYTIPPYTTAWMKLDNVWLQEVDLPKNAKIVEHEAFRGIDIPYFHLNPGLEFIGNSAFWIEKLMPKNKPGEAKVDGMETLDVPSSVKYIGPGAFRFHNFTDLYFHSAQAPICPVGKTLGDGSEMPFILGGSYMGNGGNGSMGDDYKHGYANRENYWTNDGYWFVMVHFPASADVPDLDIASYKDDTRVYNKVYGDVYHSTEEGKWEMAIPGHEQDYIARNKIWSEQGSFDYVGKEYNVVLSADGVSTQTLGSDVYGAPADKVGYGVVDSGYEDTYRGLNYIWPSQTQYERAYATVANGVNWDGVTKYRPALTDEQIALMIKDGLQLKQNGEWVTVGANVVYDEAMANAYNATLDDAWSTETVITPAEYYSVEDIYTNNLDIEGTVKIGDILYYTQQEIDDHNANFEGAKHEGDVKVQGHDEIIYTWEEFCDKANAAGMSWIFSQGATEKAYKDKNNRENWKSWWGLEYIKEPAVETSYYNAEEARAYNLEHCSEFGIEAWEAPKVKGTVETMEQANAYNAATVNDPELWTSETVKTPAVYCTQEDADAHNMTLDGHREVGYTENNTVNPAIADLISMQAFQSTRRCVFGANDGGGDHYDPKIPSSKAWWTICLPFDLTKAQIDKFFGVGTHLCKFSKVERKIKNLAANQKPYVKFFFTDDQYAKAANANDVVLEAHTAYMIFPTVDEDDAVYLANGIPMTEYYKKTGNPNPTIVTANVDDDSEGADHAKYRFIGNYDTKLPVTNPDGSVTTTDVVVPQYSYIYAKKANATGKHPYQFWFTQSAKIKWGANKCVVQSTEADRGLTDQNTFFAQEVQAAKGQTQQITILGDEADDSDATAIDVIIVAGNGEDSQVIYNLNGQKLNAVPQNGVYIKNGKKYIAK